MAIITPAQFREHYPAIEGTDEDVLLSTLIGRADSLLAAWCGYPVPDGGARTLEDVTYTFYGGDPDWEEPRRWFLPVRPVVSITSIHLDTQEDHDAATLVDSSEYVLDGEAGAIWLRPSAASVWLGGGRQTKIVAVAGFATTPPDLVAIVAAQTRHLWDLRRTLGLSSQSFPGSGATQTYADAGTLIPEAIRASLTPYVLGCSRAG